MFERSACAKVEPHTDLSALVMLGALLRDVRNRRSTAPDAADSSVSPHPGDQKRGETHATPEQTEIGTPRESSALQYAMRDRLTTLGWSEIEVIDDDLGRSAAGGVQRAGFERMVAQVCLGKVGAVAAREVTGELEARWNKGARPRGEMQPRSFCSSIGLAGSTPRYACLGGGAGNAPAPRPM